MAALAEFERELISKWTKAGIEVTRARGKRPGRSRCPARYGGIMNEHGVGG